MNEDPTGYRSILNSSRHLLQCVMKDHYRVNVADIGFTKVIFDMMVSGADVTQ